MLFLLSPAKSLDFETRVPAPILRHATEPLFNAQAAELVGVMRQKSAAEVSALMDLSPALAELNVQRFAHWQPDATPANSKPAVLAFDGDVYGGLDAKTLSTPDLKWAQNHLVLLSGLYGALRPLDRLQPYRLEMGTALANTRGRDLYAWWGDTVAAHLNERLDAAPTRTIVNLASMEYARVALAPALRPVLNARVVDCVFEDWKDGRYKIISFFAKRARGLMARHAVHVRARSVKALESFNIDGYALDRSASETDRLVFRRKLG